MKILRYAANGGVKHGVLEPDGSIRELVGSPFDRPETGRQVAVLGDVRLLAPVEPSKVIGVGLNYRSHLEEAGHATPEFPMLFMKPSTAVIASVAI
ncbi:MAG: DUF2437 domain-containing protein [Chloroflexi bacterium]|nr:DUF2437 domain-containing protein [Chloroflexota bacterium]